MSKDWTPDELQAASNAMKAAGQMSYEEFCEELTRDGFGFNAPDGASVELKPEVPAKVK